MDVDNARSSRDIKDLEVTSNASTIHTMSIIIKRWMRMFVVFAVSMVISSRHRFGEIMPKEVELMNSQIGYATRRFDSSGVLPLPGLILYLIHSICSFVGIPWDLSSVHTYRLASQVLFSISMAQVYELSREAYSSKISWIIALSHILLSARDRSIFVASDLLSVYLAFLGLAQLKKQRIIASGILLGFSVSSGWAALLIMLPMIMLYLTSMFSFVTDSRNALRTAMCMVFKRAIVFVAVPMSIYLLSFYAQYAIQNIHSEHAKGFSIEFQASLHGSTNTPSDKYLMDRSNVSILNQKHRSYLVMKDGMLTCSEHQDSSSTWTIIKLHLMSSKESSTEEDRYIQNGDLVKIVNTDTAMCLRVASQDKEDKFKSVVGFAQAESQADEDDIWQVIGDSYIFSRTSLIRFKYYKTSAELCVRNLCTNNDGDNSGGPNDKKELLQSADASLHSSHDSRLFYISDNRNHEFFRARFSDGRPKQSVFYFPAKGLFAKTVEHHLKSLFHRQLSDSTWNVLRRYFTALLSKNALYSIDSSLLLDLLVSAASISFVLVIVINHVLYMKYGVNIMRRFSGIDASADHVFVSIAYVCAIFASVTFGVGNYFAKILNVWIALGFVSFCGVWYVIVAFSIVAALSVNAFISSNI
ncbi:hypothetical protein M896_060930 [Ordospora colligata OC4]|uniref:Dolichyl-phosphate-mannose--protein mannosyltransferase n=1 Tax=Ordospora colligata OC4 TaxID=1354746 RepID=A0A0B2UKM2_9MICR|nr:uncharacterized protein M896_060930 [Ordospora colligata OC4]KHN69592.1 hypothetical protein M896_060930 [Ordospora colligata OC4]